MIRWHDEWTRGYKKEFLLESTAELLNGFGLMIGVEWDLRGRYYRLLLTKDGPVISQDYRRYRSVETAKRAGVPLIKRRVRELQERVKNELRETEEVLSSVTRRSQRKK